MANAKNKDAATLDKRKKAATVQAQKPKKTVKSAAKAGGENKTGGPAQWWSDASQFLREVKTELKKVNWPSKKQTMSSTGVVVVLVVLISAYLGLVDYLLSGFVRLMIG